MIFERFFLRKGSKTDWKRLAEMDDNAINTNDIPELDDEFFRHAKIKTNHGKLAAMKFYADILSWLKYQGHRLAGSL